MKRSHDRKVWKKVKLQTLLYLSVIFFFPNQDKAWKGSKSSSFLGKLICVWAEVPPLTGWVILGKLLVPPVPLLVSDGDNTSTYIFWVVVIIQWDNIWKAPHIILGTLWSFSKLEGSSLPLSLIVLVTAAVLLQKGASYKCWIYFE